MSLSLYRFRDIISYFPQKIKRSRDPEHIPSGVIYHACAKVVISITMYTWFELPSFTRSKDVMMAHRPKIKKIFYMILTTPISRVSCHIEANTFDIGYLCTKFDDSSISSFRDIVGATNYTKFKWVTWPWPRPFQGWFVSHRRLELAMVNLSTKFEVFIAAYYEA